MSSFWKFMGGLLVGAAAAHLVNEEYKKRKQGPPPSVGSQTQPTQEKTKPVTPKNDSETNMIEKLIREYESKKNRTRQQNDTLDLLRIKLKQLRGY